MRTVAILVVLIGGLLSSTVEAQEVRCLSQYGQTACGYDCRADYGQVRCAQTSQGACISGYGQVLCWDPSSWVQHAFGRWARQARCISQYGQLACGYSCIAEYGQVRCAQTPAGRCVGEYGRVSCYDPHPARRWGR